jgi:hypothetical protein
MAMPRAFVARSAFCALPVGPADDAAAEDVDDDAAVELALAGGVLGDVGDPQPVTHRS